MEKIPSHIAIILDGNRRYAKKKFGNALLGHYHGGKKIGNLIKWCMQEGIKELTLYCFSVENFKRDKKEIDYLFSLFRDNLRKYSDDPRINKKGICINFIGDLGLFPQDMKKGMEKLIGKTKNNKKFILNFAVGYGGRSEIVYAVKKIAEKRIPAGKINEDLIRKQLYLYDYPDLLIRTGESRISNFMIWQCAYSEMIFLPNVLWPEFSKNDFKFCLKEYSRRERRFGE